MPKPFMARFLNGESGPVDWRFRDLANPED
jgi:hypothetical protein